ncbi:MAG: FHA domain-containing protein [Deltaproteobacteria bacterium]|nr:FHA domain-containing protein [Deltaproteobacteria bacterium]
MAIELVIKDTRNEARDFSRTFIENRIVIGRSRTCHICLPDLAVSSIHMHIYLDGNNYKVMDLGSLNGTLVGKKKLIAHRPRSLFNDDIITISNYIIKFKLGVKASAFQDRNIAQVQAKEMLEAVFTDNDLVAPSLVVTKGPGLAKRFSLTRLDRNLVIGKGRHNDLDIDDRDISRKHAEIIFENDRIIVKDLNSRKGIFENGQRVETVILTPGKSFQIGNTELTLENPIEPALLAIQRAPEEETSSFSPPDHVLKLLNVKDENLFSENKIERIINADTDDEQIKTEHKDHVENLEVFEGDPLQAKESSEYIRTVEIPISEYYGKKSDTGLIIAGIILLTLSVVGLAWMLT